MNPWLEVLAFELRRLSVKDVTFRWQRPGLEKLRPIRRQLMPGTSLILDDLAREHPETVTWEREHDDGLVQLGRAAQETFDDLHRDANVRLLSAQAVEADRPLLEFPLDAESTDAIHRQIAEWSTNSAVLLPDQLGAKFWSKHRDSFMSIRNRPGSSLDAAIAAQIERDREHTQGLEALRWKLVDEFDLPADSLGVHGP